MYRVVLVDDERLILEGLSKVVKWADYGCEVAGTAHDGQEGLALIRQLKPDIVITDIRMPNMDGLTMLAALRSEFPQMQLSVLTAYRDFDYAQRAINLGVCRYLLKPSKMDELNEAIRTLNTWLPEIAASFDHVRVVDTASVLSDENGWLKESYDNSGDGIHLTTEAYRQILAYLRTHAWQ